jgi:hypothetical protein
MRAATGEVAHRLGRGHLCGVDRGRRTEPSGKIQLVVDHVDHHDPRAKRATQKQRRQADPAAADHREPFARRKRRAARERVPRRGDPAAKRGGDLGRHGVGQGRQVGIGMADRHVFRECALRGEARQHLAGTGRLLARRAIRAGAAGQDEGRDHPIPDAPALHAVAHGHDLAAEFVPGHMRQVHIGVRPGPDVPVRPADAAGQHAQHHAIGRGCGVVARRDLERRAPRGQQRSAHQRISIR